MDKGHFLYNAMKTIFERENWPENFNSSSLKEVYNFWTEHYYYIWVTINDCTNALSFIEVLLQQ